jgi:hypothetical protein
MREASASTLIPMRAGGEWIYYVVRVHVFVFFTEYYGVLFGREIFGATRLSLDKCQQLTGEEFESCHDIL